MNVVGGSESALMEEEGAAAASTGSEMRQRLYLLLFVASTLRVCSLVTEVATLEKVAALPSTSVYCKLLTLFLWLPSMLFVSMYGLVLLFWAQLCYACWGKGTPVASPRLLPLQRATLRGLCAAVRAVEHVGGTLEGLRLAARRSLLRGAVRYPVLQHSAHRLLP